VHQILVYAGDECVGWCQYGSPTELPNIKNPGAYARELVECRTGASAASSPAKVTEVGVWPEPRSQPARDAMCAAGGGVVEAYPEQVEGAALLSGVRISIPA
jgi:hypothetical protein